MRLLLYIISVSVASALAFTSCSAVGCTENQNSLPFAGFYASSTGKLIIPDSLQIWGVDAPNDSLLFGKGSVMAQIYLPFRSARQSTSFCFHYYSKALDDDRFNDTITFDYESIPYFASEDCGAMYHYRVTHMAYTTHLIESVELTDSLITNVDIERIRIYFRTAEPTDPDQQPDDTDDNTENSSENEED